MQYGKDVDWKAPEYATVYEDSLVKQAQARRLGDGLSDDEDSATLDQVEADEEDDGDE